MKRVKNYLVLKYHILVLLVHLCILLTVLGRIARYSYAPTLRHWNDIKHILWYLQGTIDIGMFYSKESKQQLLGYADAGYLLDPHKAKSQTWYVFNCNGIAISRRSFSQTMWAISSNH